MQVFPMKQPKISVIMLIHNREDYVAQAIESILSQTMREFEFLIIDNASKDKSRAVAEEYQKRDARIHIYENNTSDIGSGRNLGLKHAKGEFFTFLDDDDYCEPDFLEFLLTLAETTGADISVCGSVYDMNGEKKPKYVYEETVLCNRKEAMSYFLLRKYFNNGNATKLFRRTKEMCSVNYVENKKYDDIYTMYRFFLAVRDLPVAVAAKGEPKYIVRRHEENNSTAVLEFRKLTPQWLEEYLRMYAMRSEAISEKMPELASLARWSEYSYMISMVEKINRYQVEVCAEQLRYMVAVLSQHKEEFLRASWTREFEKEWMEEYVR